MLAGSLLRLVARVLRLASVAAVLFVAAGLIGFLVDEVRDTSTVQATLLPNPSMDRVVTTVFDLSQPDPPAAVERMREAQHTAAREAIDDVGDVLMRPFTGIAAGAHAGARRLLYSALALLLYGFVLQLLADFLRRESDGLRRSAFARRERRLAEARRLGGTYASPA